MIEKGNVKKIDGKFAVIQIERNVKECSGCSLRDECMRKEGDFIYVYNSLDAKEGDKIEFEIIERLKYLSMLLFFVLPIVLLITGILIGNKKGEIFSVFYGLMFIGIYFLILFLLEKKVRFKKGFIKMKRILYESDKD